MMTTGSNQETATVLLASIQPQSCSNPGILCAIVAHLLTNPQARACSGNRKAAKSFNS
jgi:hypothetical protein